MVEKAYRDETSSRLLDRREFLKLLGTTGGATVLGLISDAILQREGKNEQGWLNEAMLLVVAREEIKRLPQPPLFGIHPDFERNSNPWSEVLETWANVGQLNLVGRFGLVEDLNDPDKTEQHHEFFYRAEDLHFIPVWNLGTGSNGNWQTHPFHPDDYLQMEEYAFRTNEFLSHHPGMKYVRIFFEPEVQQVDGIYYGPNSACHSLTHARGFRRSFSTFQTVAHNQGDVDTQWVFCPTIWNPFEELLRETNERMMLRELDLASSSKIPYIPQIFPDAVGFDGYDLFPGKGQIQHPYYWLLNRSPEDVFIEPVVKMNEVLPEVPWFVWETGTMARSKWLRHLVLLIFALGGQGLMHFNPDKSFTNLIYEAEWTMSREDMEMYGQTLELLTAV